jgi:two-component system LytT family response regulator
MAMAFNILDSIVHKDISIIFTTAYDSYAIRAIRYSALDFLSKPIDETEFAEAIARYKTKNNVEYPLQIKNLIDNNKYSNQKIALPTMEGLVFISTGDIIKIAADGAYSLISLWQIKRMFWYQKILVSMKTYCQKRSFVVSIIRLLSTSVM